MATPVTDSEWVDVETSGRVGEDSQRKALADEIVAKALLDEWVTAREEENLLIPGSPPGCEDIDRIVTSLNVPEAMTSRLWLADTALTCPFGQMHAQGAHPQNDSGSHGVAQVPLEERPTMLSLVRIMAEQLAAQGLAIKQLRAKDAPNEDHAIPDLSKTVQDLNTSIKRMSDHIASQAEIIKHLKASQTSQPHTVEELKLGNEQLRTENTALQRTNASLVNKIETLSEMQKLSRTTLSSQQGHIESLHDVVRAKLGNNDSKISSLTERIAAAESEISTQKTTMDHQLISQDVNIRSTINSWQSDLKMDMDGLENRALTRLTNLDDKLNADMNSTMRRLADVDGKLDADMNEIHNLQETIKAQGSSIAGLTTTGDRLQEKVQVLAHDIEGLPQRFASMSLAEEVGIMRQQLLNTDQSIRDIHGELKDTKAKALEKIAKDRLYSPNSPSR